MSDQLTGGLFEPGVILSFPWWLGRVEEKETWRDNIEEKIFPNIGSIKGWGHRYKVRVFNWHTGELDKLPPKDLAFCQVIMPVTAGSGHGGASITPSIEPGSVVFGFFMDGMAGQDGYIVGVLGNSNNNVPKVRGGSAPSQTAVTPTAAGPVTSNPPTPPVGPGSLANLPLPPNVDQLSTPQLIKLLNPSRTPTKEEFAAASKARSEAKLKGLPPNEVERQVLISTVKASRQPGANAQSSGNCNLGYQQFNNTFNDSNKTPAYVPDNLNVYGIPLQITEGLNLTTLAWTTQDQDKKVQRPLRSACKKDESDLKGIAKVLTNLIKDANQIKKTAGEVSFAASSIQSQLNSLIQGSAQFISSYMTNLLNLILEKLEIEITCILQKKVVPFLFPSEIPTHNNLVSEALELLSCLFRNIIKALVPTFVKLLKDLISRLVSGPICAVQKMISDFLNPIIGQITSALSTVLGAIGDVANLVASAFDFLSGILKFFLCDEDPSCPKYDQIDLAGPAKPGIQVKNFSSGIFNQLSGGGSINCNTDPVFCGPPKVNFFGGGGSGAAANPIVSNNSSIIGFDIINPGLYTSAPIITLEDVCGNGSGGSFEAIMEPDEDNQGKLKVKNILVKSPGRGYLKKPDGSMGGDGSTWKESDEGYIKKCDGTLEIVKIKKPVTLDPGDTYYPPNGPPQTVSLDYTKYKVNIPQTIATKNCPISLKIRNLEGESKKYFGFIENDNLSLNVKPNRIARGGSKVLGEDVANGTIIVLDVGSPGIGTTAGPGIGTTAGPGIGTTAGPGIGTTSLNETDDDFEPPIIELPLLPVEPINIPVIDDFGISDTSDSDDKEKISYKVVLCIEEIQVIQGGFGYRPEDEIVITPSNGIVAKPIINEYGQITEVKVLNGGCGFNDIPEIKTNSPTGFNALLIPIITVKRLSKDEEFDIPKDTKVINVVDCTGCIKCLGGS
jgi:hypothetical protein